MRPKELHEYVEFEDFDLIKTDLDRISQDLKKAMEDCVHAFNLIKERHKEVVKADQLAKSIISDLKLLNRDMYRKVFEDVIKKVRLEPKIEGPEIKPEKRAETLKVSGAALAKLKRNLTELRRELGLE